MFKLDNQINSQVKLFLYFINKNQTNYPLLLEHKKYLYQCLYLYKEDKFYYFLAFLNPNCYIGYYDTIFKNTIQQKLEENQDIKPFINEFGNYKFDRFCKFKYLLDKEILFLNYLLETMILNPLFVLSSKTINKLRKRIEMKDYHKSFYKFSSKIDIGNNKLVDVKLFLSKFAQNEKVKAIFQEELSLLAIEV